MIEKMYILSRIHTIHFYDSNYSEGSDVFVRYPIMVSTDINRLKQIGEGLLLEVFKPEDLSGELDVDSIRGVTDISLYPDYAEEYYLKCGESSGMIIEMIKMT